MVDFPSFLHRRCNMVRVSQLFSITVENARPSTRRSAAVAYDVDVTVTLETGTLEATMTFTRGKEHESEEWFDEGLFEALQDGDPEASATVVEQTKRQVRDAIHLAMLASKPPPGA